MAFYVFGEDLVAGLVGPFAARIDAEAHIAFCDARGDADPGRVVDATHADLLRRAGLVDVEVTPDQDRALILPD